jgi:hypothetical protein
MRGTPELACRFGNTCKLLFYKVFLITVCGKIHAFTGSPGGQTRLPADPNIIKQRKRGQ